MVKINDVIAISVDIQERLLPVIHQKDELLEQVRILIEGLKLMDIPVLIPRQYPKGIGDTVQTVRDAVGEHTPIDKTSFGCLGEPEFINALSGYPQKTVIVFGIEAHICVLQTVLQLLDKNYNVLLVCDAIGSRKVFDKEIAIQRAAKEGAVLTTVEALLFELLENSRHPQFKAISALVK